MSRKYAQISLDVWADPDFRQLTHGAQWLYWLLISQPTVTAAGVLPLQERRWAKLAADLGRDDVEKLLAELAAARYVLVDDDTEEVLIRSYLRNGGGWRQPNLAKTAMTEATQIISPRLRAAMREELCRIEFNTLTGARSDATRALARDAIAALSPKEPAPRPVWDGGTHGVRDTGRDGRTHGARDGVRDTPASHGASHSQSTDQPIAEPIDPTDGTGTGTVTSPSSPVPPSPQERETKDEKNLQRITGATDATDTEAAALLTHVRATKAPRSLGGYLRTLAENGDLQGVLDDWRTTPQADTRAPRDKPRCATHRLIEPCSSCAGDRKAGDA